MVYNAAKSLKSKIDEVIQKVSKQISKLDDPIELKEWLDNPKNVKGLLEENAALAKYGDEVAKGKMTMDDVILQMKIDNVQSKIDDAKTWGWFKDNSGYKNEKWLKLPPPDDPRWYDMRKEMVEIPGSCKMELSSFQSVYA